MPCMHVSVRVTALKKSAASLSETRGHKEPQWPPCFLVVSHIKPLKADLSAGAVRPQLT